MSGIDSLFMLAIACGILCTTVAELLPYAIRVAGQVAALEVYAAGFQVFVAFFARLFLLLVAPLCGFAFESRILNLSQIELALGFSYVSSIAAITIFFIFLDKIFVFFANYVRLAEPTNTYFKMSIPIKAARKSCSNDSIDLKFDMLARHPSGPTNTRAFLLGGFFSGAFSSAIIPVIVILALSYPSYRLTIFAFGPLITFVGSFSNVVLVEKNLALNSQRKIPNAQFAFQLRAGRLIGVTFSFGAFLALVTLDLA